MTSRCYSHPPSCIVSNHPAYVTLVQAHTPGHLVIVSLPLSQEVKVDRPSLVDLTCDLIPNTKALFKMPSGIMDSHDGATTGTPGHQRQHMHHDQEQQHQRPLPGHLDDGASSSSPSRSSYSQDFSKPTNLLQFKKTSLLSSLNPRNWTRKMRLFAIIGFVLTVVALVPGNYSPLTVLRRLPQG